MANYSKPIILTLGSKGGVGTAETVPTVAGADTTASGAYLDDLLIGTSDNDVIAGLTLTALTQAVAFTGLDGDGVGGANTMEGGGGDDQYVVNDQGDVVVELLGEGNNDTVFTAVSYTLKDNVENIVALGDAGITLTGNKLGNLLDGSQTAVSDTLVGLEGDDVYIIGGTNLVTQDKVFELVKTGGTDTIVVDLTAVTPIAIDISKDSNQIKGATNIENVILTDDTSTVRVTGNALNNRLVGNGDANTLIGNDGNDTLDGGVEADDTVDDRLEGGRGNDTYIIRNTDDVILELSNSGTDTVRSYATYEIDGGTTTTGQNVEHITLLGSDDIDATGNALANQLIGNTGANSLVGGANNDTLTGNQGNDTLNGGIGNDSMTGGKGDDSYVVDATGDKVIETNDDIDETQGGDDLVTSSITYTLPANVEQLTLSVPASGSANINATGNTLNNTIIGNTGNNSINGGIGDDTMTGGLGDDTYIIDSTDDSVVELTGGGSDTIKSSVSLAVAKTAFVETIILTGIDAIDAVASDSFSGTGVTVIGNDVDNAITGGAGADTLKGDTTSTGTKGGIDTILGGAGADTIYGYAGDDQLNGEAGADTLFGGEGNDTLTEADTTGGNTLNGDKGNDTISSGVGADSLNGGDGDDVITTGDTPAGDTVTGGTGNDTVTGGSGTDSISGDAGNDVINGAAGADIIFGNDGNDTITGGAGKDVIDPGAGNDTLVFAAGVADTFTGGLVANIDQYVSLSLKAGSGDLIDLSVSVARIGAAVTGALNLTGTDADFIASMNTLLNASGVGFDTGTAGITAAVVTDTGAGNRKFLAVDIDNNAASTFTAADFVIELTGTATSFAGMTTASFV